MYREPRTHEEYIAQQRIENNPGLLREMTPAEVGGFRRMLKRIRRELNKPAYFEELLRRGIKCFNLRQAAVIDDKAGKFSHVAYQWSRTKIYEAVGVPAAEATRRRGLGLLREALNDKVRFNQLAQLGPYSISICFWYEEAELLEPGLDFMAHLDLLIENHIPACIPNADWSIDARTGVVYYHS